MNFQDPKDRAALAKRANGNYRRMVRQGEIRGSYVEPTDVLFAEPTPKWGYEDPHTLLLVDGRTVIGEFFIQEIGVKTDFRGKHRIDDGKVRLLWRSLSPYEQETRLRDLEGKGYRLTSSPPAGPVSKV
jgi:hypothetical protein